MLTLLYFLLLTRANFFSFALFFVVIIRLLTCSCSPNKRGTLVGELDHPMLNTNSTYEIDTDYLIF